MSIHFEHGIDVGKSPEEAFAVLDDVSKTPKWLARCTGIEKLSPGPNAVGTKLRYSYKEGGRTGVMDGEITTRAPNERLTFHYADKMMEVTVDFRISKASGGARLVHAIDITPRTFMAKLFSPLIRRQLPKQTITAMETLKALLES
jgi:hypothetical protein